MTENGDRGHQPRVIITLEVVEGGGIAPSITVEKMPRTQGRLWLTVLDALMNAQKLAFQQLLQENRGQSALTIARELPGRTP